MKIAGSILLLFLCCINQRVEAADQPSVEPIHHEIYVSPAGSDENAGTKNSPFKTLKKAGKVAKSGTTVNIRGGVYHEKLVIGRSGNKQHPIIFRNYKNERPIISGKKIKSGSSDGGLVTIKNKSYITIQGLNIGHFSTLKEQSTPCGILVEGRGKGLRIINNHIFDIKTAHKKGNAHGIAFYGSEAPLSLNNIEISGNLLENLTLGFSEALTLNGNVKKFVVRANTIRNVNNIGIDIIGFEKIAPNQKFDQAREGVISENSIYNVSSYSNQAYRHEYSAGGIYVDGGKDVVIEHNISSHNDLGIEIASEHQGKQTSNIQVIGNIIYENRFTGISIGGYDQKRGGTMNTSIAQNILYGNDTIKMDGGQLLMQYHATHNIINDNIMVSVKSNLLLANLHYSNKYNEISNNVYLNKSSHTMNRWIWNGQEIESSTFGSSRFFQ
ncbi:DUF1565 domain-containing protein [Priestia aryabhattai]|uniref:DUF1565 domain-containing protein n=1 Tax=Priestia aryabhattai TaxID=412384 RepID=UPI0023801714|nr:DUF1565 domain-containing protein [Priestia aryabhattai]WDW10713.1 DUF1565 domain-containing protein [Priestia aryabhattai]